METKTFVVSNNTTRLFSVEIDIFLKKFINYNLSQSKMIHGVYVLGSYKEGNEKGDDVTITPYFIGLCKTENVSTCIHEKIEFYKNHDENINVFSVFTFKKEREAYLFASTKYHEFKEQLHNDYHPERPLDSGWKCPEEFKCDYKPENPIKI